MTKHNHTKRLRRGEAKARGRPCLLTSEMHAFLVGAVTISATDKIAALAAGISPKTLTEWLRAGRADIEAGEESVFADLVMDLNKGRGRGSLSLLKSVHTQIKGKRCVVCQGRGAMPACELGAAANNTTLTRCPACGGTGQQIKGDGRLALEMLGRKHPETYGRKDRHEITGPTGGPVVVDVQHTAATAAVDLSTLSAAELAALAGATVAESTARLGVDDLDGARAPRQRRQLIPARLEDSE